MVANSRSGLPFTKVALNVSILIGLWIASFALVQIAQRISDSWALTDAAQLLASAAVLATAVRMKAKIAAYVTAAIVVFAAAELALHGLYGIRAVQGGATHLAVLTAGVGGVLLGVYLHSAGDRTARA